MVRPKKSQTIPERGNVLWLCFSSHVGREQGGRRPAVVLSPRKYNERTGLAIVCPVTSREKGYAGEVACVIGDRRSFILSDQVKSLDWRGRKYEVIDNLAQSILEAVCDRIVALIQAN